MNIEDKYKQSFKNHKVSTDSQLWNKINTRLEVKKKRINYTWIAAACLIIGIFIVNYTAPETNQLATKIVNTPTNTTTAIEIIDEEDQSIIPVKLAEVKPINRTLQDFVSLQTIEITNINSTPITASLRRDNITFVQLNIKAQKDIPLKKKSKNNIERIINIAKLAMRKSRKSIEIPVIEIDYKSLLTLNNKQ